LGEEFRLPPAGALRSLCDEAMISLCPSCWHAVEPLASRCQHCDADLVTLDQRTYTEQLIAALQHPDAETVMRAANMLADRCDRGAVCALTAALRRHWHDPRLAAAIVRALARFDDVQAREAVEEALGHESFIVRKEAAVALQGGPGAAQRKWFAGTDL